MDLFVVPTISFRLLYGLLMYGLILLHDRRRILWLGATTHPTAEWIARQLIEACGCKQAPHYLVHDRDRSYGEVFLRRVGAMGIRDRPTSPRSPWQNGYAERLIGSIRRECIDRVVVLVNDTCVTYCCHTSSTTMRRARPRAVEAIGCILSRPVLGGLHHQYVRT
jgi:transposase InsO family protein